MTPTDPQTLMDAARCYRCIPRGLQSSVIIHLLEEWANSAGPVGCLVSWEPSTAGGQYQLVSNPGVWVPFADLATFQAVDPLTVLMLDLTSAGITSISGLQCLENATLIGLDNNPLTTVDVSELQFLEILNALCTLTSLDIDNCPLLDTVNLADNFLPEAQVDNVLCTLDASGLLNGAVDLSGATNAYASVAGLVCATNLVAKGWTVYIRLHAMVDDWNTRVIANGGTAPTFEMLGHVSTFAQGLESSTILNKMQAICIFAPGASSPAVNASDMIRAMTPLMASGGNDPWLQTGFPIGNLTVDGLKGDGGAHHIETGIAADSIFTTSTAGVTIYNTFLSETGDNDCFAFNGVSQMLQFFPAFNNDTIFDCWDNNLGGGRMQIANVNDGVCYVSGNRTASNAAAIYAATSGIAHSAITTINTTGGSLPTANLMLLYSPKRFSFVAFHYGLTQAESLTFFNLIQALRTALGGGYV